jgi:hypothetical protein
MMDVSHCPGVVMGLCGYGISALNLACGFYAATDAT